jgi:hypothetical protein
MAAWLVHTIDMSELEVHSKAMRSIVFGNQRIEVRRQSQLIYVLNWF